MYWRRYTDYFRNIKKIDAQNPTLDTEKYIYYANRCIFLKDEKTAILTEKQPFLCVKRKNLITFTLLFQISSKFIYHRLFMFC